MAEPRSLDFLSWAPTLSETVLIFHDMLKEFGIGFFVEKR